MRYALAVIGGAVVAASCATAPPPVVAPPPPTFDQKMAAILHLEDRRTLADPVITPPEVSALAGLLTDEAARVRRRAALAAGRVGLPDAVAPLTALLAGDVEPEVRDMAAFALGLVGDAAAAPALLSALADSDARVQGRAAEALGLIGYKAGAGSIAGMAAAHVTAGALAGVESDNQGEPAPTPQAEAVRLAVFALTRLDAFDELRAVVVGPDGAPVSDWWPLAFAMQRIARPAAASTLRTWLARGGPTTRALAVRGLGTLKDGAARPDLEALARDDRQPLGVRVQAVRALASIGDRRSADVLGTLATSSTVNALRLEATAAFADVADPASAELLVDYLEDAGPSMRAAAQAALAKADPETFMTVLSGLDVDPEWRVRASLATTLGLLPAERSALRLEQLARDSDARVRAAALQSLAKVKAPSAERLLVDAVAANDPILRTAGARGLAVLKPAGAGAALASAYEAAASDPSYVPRAAILDALVAVDPGAARGLLTSALADRDWALRVRAAALLKSLDPAADAEPRRPGPPPVEPAVDATAAMIAPRYSPQAYVQTSRGEFRIELAVLDAPRTVASFIALTRKGFFDGTAWHRVVPDFVVQGGDPRGDGDGGPGYSLRDELNMRPYVRGTVGMALDWEDTGGSQFFIALSPQPHLDARYTAFGTVVEGMDVVDRLEPFDRIVAVRVWDGEGWIGAAR